MADEPGAKNQHYWTLDKVASAIAVATFLFGFGSFAQAKDLFTGATQAAQAKLAQQEQQQLATDQYKTQQQNLRQSLIKDYVEVADQECQPVVSQDTNRPARYDYQADLRISELRAQMLVNMEAVPRKDLPADQIPVARKIISEFQAANDYWAAVTSAFAAGNIGVEDSALGQFTLAEGAFEADAAQFGFQVCDHAWPNLDPS